jgi:hypothetical protein
VRTKVHRKDYGWSVGLVYDTRGLSGVTTVRFGVPGVFIPPRYTFFFRSPPAKNSEVKRACLGAILGWVTDREVFSGVHK